MKNFTAPLPPLSSVTENWDNNTGKMKQLFKSITGYDIMFEESRKDIVAAGNSMAFTAFANAFSALLFNSIKKASNVAKARMM